MNRIISSLIAIFVASNLSAQQAAPKLVVCITIDQLRGDYIEYFYNTFGERGFKRLMNEGAVYKNLRFEFNNIDEASAFATLFTGSNPCFNGITGKKSYDFENNKEYSCLYDPEYIGNYTKENYSPAKLLSSTIGDELKIASKGRSDVYSIAPNAESAILSAGHAANAAFWIDDTNGKWATTTFYKSIPWYVDRYNSGIESLAVRADQMVWTPTLPIERYNALPYVLEDIPFRYSFKEKTADRYKNLKTSPFINKEVNRLALQFIQYGDLGGRSCPDMLSLTYYAGNYRTIAQKEFTREIQDTYQQLDKDIEQLLDAIDKKIGLKNTLIVVTGTGYHYIEETFEEQFPLSGGEFHPKRCVALLNMYLMAIYGQQDWVKGYHNQQLFLNKKAIEDAKLDLKDVQDKAAEFVTQFSGVQQVTTDISLHTGAWNEGTAKFRNGTFHKGRGDLIIELQPGWKINNDQPEEKVKMVRNNAIITPLIFMGNGLKPQHIYREVKATEVAPTVTHVLRIRPPNACLDIPLFELSSNK
ncbi:alkaline phosphatase family protein [Parabacteroides sp. Marseille-P3160]|uniref:alkaline phosphatase family protein n=1 Tax=Parabacteroides sp. Marseille-P3160 TaxID=1917887 RepID=UPI0009BB5CF0|nr:alkaline phosphatase family protein [Parabacteroides sp. Marseille-P3160]